MPKLDFAHYQGREHAYIKHYLLSEYLSKWGYKIGSKWDPLVFIDGFAGPWGSRDHEFSDTSFGIATTAMKDAIQGLSKINRNTHGVCIFVEKAHKPFLRLEKYANAYSTDIVRAVAFEGRFTDRITDINQYIRTQGDNPFKLVLLDQKGWAGAPMNQIRTFVGTRGSELLFNVMTSFLTRFLERDDLTTSYDSYFGRDGVVDRLRKLPKGNGLREQVAVDEYCLSLQTLCGFRYVSQAVIMDATKERIRYYFVFATNSIHGITVFKNAEANAASVQNEVRHNIWSQQQSQIGLPFGGDAPKSLLVNQLQVQYLNRSKMRVLEYLINNNESSYDEVFAVAMMFPLVTKADLDYMLANMSPHVQIKLKGGHRKHPGLFKGDLVKVFNSKNLSAMAGSHTLR